MYFKFIAFLFFNFLAHHSFAAQSDCNDISVQGYCTSEVKEAIDVCKDKESGEDIAGRYAELKNTKLTRDTKLGELSSKYRDLEKSSKSEAQNKKACYEVATALRQDCVDRCKKAPSSADCDSSLESIDQVRKYCKKSEQAAEEMAAIAAENAATFGSAPLDFGSSSSFSSNSNSSSGNPTAPGTVNIPSGYTGQTVGTSLPKAGEVDGNITDSIAKGLGAGSGSNSGAGGSGGTIGSSGAAGELGATGNGKKGAEGIGVEGAGAGGANRGGGSGAGAGGASVSSAKSDGTPGYMLWGAPARKKKAPLTLLKTKEGSASSTSSASSKSSGTIQNNTTKSPVPK